MDLKGTGRVDVFCHRFKSIHFASTERTHNPPRVKRLFWCENFSEHLEGRKTRKDAPKGVAVFFRSFPTSFTPSGKMRIKGN
mmetsp:Transcript_40191/g.45948  ORF Transcript_40191/g.45948 Transcript_40191/m.45948 type:complete len:82 (+) Transcript_40191:539-784(+)